MKLTPFILFILLLFILVISIIFSRFLPIINSTEGFISFSKNKEPLNYETITRYSNTGTTTVVKLYDNLFFDTKNANIIEVNGNAYVGGVTPGVGGNIDTTGASITGIYVITRNGTISDMNTNIDEYSRIDNVTSNYTSWNYETRTNTTNRYQLFYISWDKYTYIHIIDKTNTSHIASFMFGINNIMKQHKYENSNSITLNNYTQETDSNIGRFVKLSNYTHNLYKISNEVHFDCSNSNLVITNKINTDIKVYNRDGNIITDYNTHVKNTIPNADFNYKTFIISDSSSKNMVIYLPDGQMTVVALINLDNSNSKFRFGNVVRFSSTGKDDGTSSGSGGVNHNYNDGRGRGHRHDHDDDYDSDDDYDPTSDYYKWLAYWNTSVNPNSGNSRINFNDYMLKTQIVPPVCPTCPSCHVTSGVCTGCGGQGGSGTKNSNNQSVVGNVQLQDNNLGIAAATSDIARTGGSVINNTVDNITGLGVGAGLGAYSLLSNTGSGTVDLLKSAGSGTKDMLSSTGSGAVDLVTNASTGAVNLVTTAGSGATDLLRSAGSGILNLGRDNNGGYAGGAVGGSGGGVGGAGGGAGGAGVGGSGGGAVSGADYFSYYGALPNRQSNFMPVTADFSAFSK